MSNTNNITNQTANEIKLVRRISNSEQEGPLTGKRKIVEISNSKQDESQEFQFPTSTLNESQDIQEDLGIENDLRLENLQLKQSLLLLVLGAEEREEWPAKWQELVSKVVEKNILSDISNRIFNDEFIIELDNYFKIGSSNSVMNSDACVEWIRNRIKPFVAFNSLLEPVSKKIKMNNELSPEGNISLEDSPIF